MLASEAVDVERCVEVPRPRGVASPAAAHPPGGAGAPARVMIDAARAVLGVGALAGEAALGGVGLVDVEHAVPAALEQASDGRGRAWGASAQVVARAVAEGDDRRDRPPKAVLEGAQQPRLAPLLPAVRVEALATMEALRPERVGGSRVGAEGGDGDAARADPAASSLTPIYERRGERNSVLSVLNSEEQVPVPYECPKATESFCPHRCRLLLPWWRSMRGVCVPGQTVCERVCLCARTHH